MGAHEKTTEKLGNDKGAPAWRACGAPSDNISRSSDGVKKVRLEALASKFGLGKTPGMSLGGRVGILGTSSIAKERVFSRPKHDGGGIIRSCDMFCNDIWQKPTREKRRLVVACCVRKMGN